MEDRKFPGREYGQITSRGDMPQEWAVDRITSLMGKGREAIFELLWKSGDRTWEPYRSVRHLEALEAYCEAQGVKNAKSLPEEPADQAESEEDKQVNCKQPKARTSIKTGREETKRSTPPTSPPSIDLLQIAYTDHPPFTRPICPMSDAPGSSNLSDQALKTILESNLRVIREAKHVFDPRDRRRRFDGPYRRKTKHKASEHQGHDPDRAGRCKTHRGRRPGPKPTDLGRDDASGAQGAPELAQTAAPAGLGLSASQWAGSYDATPGVQQAIDALRAAKAREKATDATRQLAEQNPPVPAYILISTNDDQYHAAPPPQVEATQYPPVEWIRNILNSQTQQTDFEPDYDMDDPVG